MHLFLPQVDCLGHLFNPTSLPPLSSKVQPILSFPPPMDLSSLQPFLGMLNFLLLFPSRHSPDPPTPHSCPRSNPFAWSPDMENPFRLQHMFWYLPFLSITPPLRSPFLSLRTHQTPTWVLSCNNILRAPGNPLPFSIANFLLCNPITPR